MEILEGIFSVIISIIGVMAMVFVPQLLLQLGHEKIQKRKIKRRL